MEYSLERDPTRKNAQTGRIVLAVIVCYDGEKSKRGCFMEINKKTLRRILLIILFAVVLIWAVFVPAQSGAVLSKIGGILSPFVIGGALAFIINVPMRAIESRLFQKRTRLQKLRRPIALVLALLFVLLVVAFVIMAVVPELVRTIYLIAESVPAYLTELSEKIVDWANRAFNETPELLDWINSIQINWGGLAEKLLGFVQSGVTDVVGSTVGFAVSLFGGIANFFVSLIFAIYVLFSKEILCRQCKMLLYGWLSEARADRVVEIAVLSRKAFANFITGQCLEACILGAMFALSMWIFRFPHVMLISVLVGFLALIPIFGAFIGCIVGAFLILVQNPMQAVWFVVMFLVIQQIEGNVIYPKVVGKSVGLPAIWVLIACTVGGSAFGLMGMVVMIPICSVVYTVVGTNAYKRIRERDIKPDKL